MAWAASEKLGLAASEEAVDSAFEEEAVDELALEAVFSTPDDDAPQPGSAIDEALALEYDETDVYEFLATLEEELV